MNWRIHCSKEQVTWQLNSQSMHHTCMCTDYLGSLPTCLHCCLTCSESAVTDNWQTFCISSNTSPQTNLRPKMACTRTKSVYATHQASYNVVHLKQREGCALALMVMDVFFNKAEQDSEFILWHILLFEVPQDHRHCLTTSCLHHQS